MSDSATTELIIEAGHTERNYWRDLFRYRELFYFLAWRDVLVRYKQTVIGVLWAVLRPLLTMIVFTFVFSRIAKLPAEGVPYPVMVFAAMLPWQLFATSLTEGSGSLINNANLISKVYFPRLIVPASAVIVSFVDFAISMVLLGVLMAVYRVTPGASLLVLPFFTILALLASAGAGVWLAALNVKYRDFRYVVPFIVQFGLYISPVGFSSAIVPEKWRMLYALNPMVGVIDGFRWCVSHGRTPFPALSLELSLVTVAIVLATGIWYFRKTERTFADVI
ncbi:MAG: ABC transporter permease [Chthoniobacterales bacterium]